MLFLLIVLVAVVRIEKEEGEIKEEAGEEKEKALVNEKKARKKWEIRRREGRIEEGPFILNSTKLLAK